MALVQSPARGAENFSGVALGECDFAAPGAASMLQIMFRSPFSAGMAVIAALMLGGCDRLSLGPPDAEPAPVTASPAAPPAVIVPDLRGHAGETYAAFVAASGASYAPDALGLGAADRARVWRAMAASESARVLSGGGAEALVFRGCAETGCGDGVAIVAMDIASGGTFVGVKDAGGAEVLLPNDRVEALLRLNSPTRSWDNPEAAPAPQ